MKTTELEIGVGTVEGTIEECAQQIIQEVVAKAHDAIKEKTPAQAHKFAFCVAGSAIASFLSSTPIEQLDKAAEAIIGATNAMVEEIKKDQQKPC